MEVVYVITYVCQVRTWTDAAWEQSGENVHEITMDDSSYQKLLYFFALSCYDAGVKVKQ
jgi:hypothetical protein